MEIAYPASDAATATAPTPFPFRTLPPEIRNLIYRLLFVKNAKTINGGAHPQILRTCWQLNQEATRLLYSACVTEVFVHYDGIYFRNGLSLCTSHFSNHPGREPSTRHRRQEHLKCLRRFELFTVHIIDNRSCGRPRPERNVLNQAVMDLCKVLAENQYLRSLCVDVDVRNWEQKAGAGEKERMLLGPFGLLRGLRDVKFTGAIDDVAYAEGIAEKTMRRKGEEVVALGELDELDELQLAAWEDVEGSAL